MGLGFYALAGHVDWLSISPSLCKLAPSGNKNLPHPPPHGPGGCSHKSRWLWDSPAAGGVGWRPSGFSVAGLPQVRRTVQPGPQPEDPCCGQQATLHTEGRGMGSCQLLSLGAGQELG